MTQAPQDLGDDQIEQKNWFRNFLESDIGRRTDEHINQMIAANSTRCVVNFSDIREFSQTSPTADETNVADRAKRKPNDYLPYWGLAVAEIVERRAALDFLKKDFRRRVCHIGVEGPLGANLVTPRTLTASFMGQLVMVDGIVTRCSVVRPKILESVHYSEAKNEFQRKEYRDELSPFIDATHMPTINVFPKKDADGNPLRTEYGLCTFSDHQTLTLQEMPEAAPVGQLPRSVDVRLEDDLVDRLKPGDRVRICGVYQAYTNPGAVKNGEDQSIRFSTVLVANNIIHLGKKLREPELTVKDRANINELQRSRGAALLRYLAEGIAPAIYGLEHEKQAILLMLLGGEERKFEQTRIRGDMNILMVGEPSTAKSQLLRFVLNLAPLALSTTGRGSSGVGLTAAVTLDRDSGERTLSAGAMVLGDRGIVCIDEFDKMSDIDRVAMHEAMEQGSVTIAKAGIHASLNSRCSVLAAANPIYGFYIPHLKAANIGLPESLQSRFDLIFIVLDKGQSAEHNKRIAAHVLGNHSSAEPADKCRQQMDCEMEDPGKDRTTKPTEEFGKRKIVSAQFLRKYIQFAKANYHPVLNEEAHHEVVEAYVELRGRMKAKDISMRITPRTLETIIRLSTAHAKLRLSEVVEKTDVDIATSLIKHTLTMVSDQPVKHVPVPEEAVSEEPQGKRPRLDTAEEQSGVERGREQEIMEVVAEMMKHAGQAQLFHIRDTINARREFSNRQIGANQLEAVLKKMDRNEVIVYDEGVVYRL